MKPTHHVIISTGVSAVFWWWFKSVPATAVCFLSGIFIDIDHHLDYWLIKGKFPWRYRDLHKFFIEQENRGGPMYLVLHAWEWLIALWLAIFILRLDVVWVGFAIGLTAHMMADLICNPLKPFGYFITYRWRRAFDSTRILKPLNQG